ncbi:MULTISPECIES: TetR/AcrR family transcriptional regulator [Burkholderia]|uniref:TetR family transcriptional regulator n=1 Tax=Burkholderia cenocepacia TaxID=95486 RepID=A0A071MSP1_9BURK|nr:TetR/AcrR family transcriptional regulator [Burkholderia seminalis]MBJ9589149.1 TetR/AcrR family transcriptional regulator [Burkholderia seminalis]MCA8304597.1 TetR/AcrR family transcriptional regulator [Burkholderia seminalis]MCA8433600.1 TetR/AcrR family transcriptional regulator [Burkholderia seminalis]QTO21283.1 TetR/AcrR family transcriptional regulator [Burkholderia seminalis]RQS85578.1 TetR/AcrR family transcriptional regulator [Burkholderia seminalis]
MRYSVEHKHETRTRILEAASRLFRQEGYGGSGIGPLTKAAGVTNGAFYGHFKSKGEAFRTVVLDGLDQLRQGVAALKAEHGARWRRPFVSFYLGPRRTCALGESCALPSLSPEVMRADDDTRDAYEQALRQIVDEVSSGLGDRPDDDRAIAFLALLSGGVTLARAVRDPELAQRIADAVGRYAVVIAERTDVQPERQP